MRNGIWGAGALAVVTLLMGVAPSASAPDSAPTTGTQRRVRLERRIEPDATIRQVFLSSASGGKARVPVVAAQSGVKTLGLFGRYKTKVRTGGDDEEVLAVPGQYGKVMGIHITRGHAQARDGWTSGEFLILNAEGETTLHLKRFDVQANPQPSPSGDYAVAGPGPVGPSGPPRFYDANGIRNQWALGDSKKHWPERHHVGQVVFSPDGGRVAIEAVKGAGYKSIVYDSRGNRLWDLPLRGAVIFSPASNEVALVAESQLLFFDGSGRQLRSFEVLGIGPWSLGRYSQNGNTLALTTNQSKLISIDIQSGKIAWERLPSDAAGVKGLGPGVRTRLAGLDASADLGTIAIAALTFRDVVFDAGGGLTGTDTEFLRSHVIMYDHDGKFLDEIALPPDSFLMHGPNIASIGVSSDGRQIVVPTKAEILFYSVSERP